MKISTFAMIVKIFLTFCVGQGLGLLKDDYLDDDKETKYGFVVVVGSGHVVLLEDY